MPVEQASKKKKAEKRGKEEIDESGKEEAGEKDSIDRLHTMEDADWKHWKETLMPSGSRCMIVGGLYVVPEFQGRGVGGALLKWGTNIAD